MAARSDVQVTIRVDRDLKEAAENLFNRLGMNMSTALNVFLRKAVDENGIPFMLSVKSTGFGPAGYSTDDITALFKASVEREMAQKKQAGLPVSGYEFDSKRAYLEYPDGRREYVND
ncbi:MAG: type II toxin-antitoxin system RelB/DinJ family antitoxin [Clostridia bacterium]|jgi:addiction module RelB/DinJ family antitoxin|nr:type II toxin-antitoxin system RelB/DinJ family antitoxin [Clostridia bacterium]